MLNLKYNYYSSGSRALFKQETLIFNIIPDFYRFFVKLKNKNKICCKIISNS